MSRTIRRKNYEQEDSRSWGKRGRKIAGYYTVEDYHPGGYDGDHWYRGWYTYRAPTKRERDEEYWRIHSDSNTSWYWGNPSPWVKRQCQKCQRQRGRQELHKFMMNEEYEPMIEHKRDKTWQYWL